MLSIIKKYIKIIFQKKVFEPVYIPVKSGNILKKSNILITGGGSGLGYGIAEACIRNGANVIITGRNIDKLKKASVLLEKEFNVEVKFVQLDITQVDSFDSKIIEIEKLLNGDQITTLINNAGVSGGNSIGQTEVTSYDIVLETNLRGMYFLSQVFSNYLIKNKIKGNILNILSSSSLRPAITPYMVSKWGAVGLTQGLAKKLIQYDIVVNSIAPGPTAAGMLDDNDENLYHVNSPAKRYCTAAEIGNLAVFMVSGMGRMIVGDTVYISGGIGNLTVDDIKY